MPVSVSYQSAHLIPITSWCATGSCRKLSRRFAPLDSTLWTEFAFGVAFAVRRLAPGGSVLASRSTTICPRYALSVNAEREPFAKRPNKCMLAVLQMELQRLPGFRDFYPEDRAWLNYIIECWRTTAANFGFAEYDGPTLESTDLYKKKSGEELKSQLFRFEDQGGRDVCLRPEMTPTLARLVAARERDFKKPIKWFSIAPFFRFEKPQKGRLREFYQINCDLIGDNSPAADAELISLAIRLLRGFGLTERDFSVRLSNRNLWSEFLKRHDVPLDRTAEFFGVLERLCPQ